MFASAEIQFVKPLAVNAEATAVSSITDVRGRSGRTGDLVIVDVQRSIEQFGVSCIQERQSIVYREAGTPIAEIVEEPIVGQSPEPQWCPSPVDLFRFSAATSNSHRIHYDHIYATQVEGYPRLVVQGPLIAARLFAYASSHTQLPIRRYVFRSVAPCFVWQAIRFGHGESRAELRATRCDGVIAMEATAQ
jgi:3-methylfumaryl-CoA hydratase